MSRRTSDSEYRRTQTIISTIYLLLIGMLTVASARAEEVEERTSVTRHFVEGGRESGSAPIETMDRFKAIERSGERVRPSLKSDGDGPAKARQLSNDFWIYDADVVLFGDDDNDGFFHGVDLLFDADTVWTDAWVYAVVYLSLDGGPWNEYASTEDFLIAGATSDDEYVLVTELSTGYPTGDYDLLIELYDADTGDFLTDFGPESSSELSYLPLEDFNRDAPVVLGPGLTVVQRNGGGGSASLLLVATLASFLLLRTAIRRRVPARSRSSERQ